MCWRFGREGEGPGEFQSLSGAWAGSGGRVFAVDGWQLRITEFGPVGEIQCMWRIEGVAVPIHFQFHGTGGPGSILSSVTTLGARDPSHGEASRSSMDFRLFDTDGKLHRIARLAETPPARTEEDLEAWVPNERLRALAADFPLPATIPGYHRLTAADSGEIRARRYPSPRAATARWDVFRPDGHYLGRVDVPASFRLHAVSGDQLMGVHEDELGVQRVQVRDLTLGGAGR